MTFWTTSLKEPVQSLGALRSHLLQKDKQLTRMMEKLETQRRIAERAIARVRRHVEDPFAEEDLGEEMLDVFQHMLDELTRSEVE